MYLTYEEYMGMGGGAQQSAFPRLEAKARAAVSGREIAAMSNDGVSVSFTTSGKAASRYTAIVRTWMAMETDAFGVPLMYPGVCVT